MARRAFFFDRDGVLNQSPGEGYVLSWDAWEWDDGIFELLRAVKNLGFVTVLVTNQRCVGKGLLTLEELDTIHRRMQERLAEEGLEFEGIYSFTGLPDSVNLAKPDPQMLLRARDELDLDLAASWMIGDADRDIEMAQRAGVGKTIRVRGDKPIGVKATVHVEHVSQCYHNYWRTLIQAVPGNWDFAFEDALDLEERARWMVERAKLGSPQDLRNLGCAYIWGEDDPFPSGFPKNLERARYWYTIAADLGHFEAMWDVAGMWIWGEGGPPDLERGMRYLRTLAPRPYAYDWRNGILAAEQLARLLSAENPVPGIAPDPEEAEYWRQVAEASEKDYGSIHEF